MHGTDSAADARGDLGSRGALTRGLRVLGIQRVVQRALIRSDAPDDAMRLRGAERRLVADAEGCRGGEARHALALALGELARERLAPRLVRRLARRVVSVAPRREPQPVERVAHGAAIRTDLRRGVSHGHTLAHHEPHRRPRRGARWVRRRVRPQPRQRDALLGAAHLRLVGADAAVKREALQLPVRRRGGEDGGAGDGLVKVQRDSVIVLAVVEDHGVTFATAPP